MNPQKGATLTELLVALAVSLVVIGAVYGVHLMQVRQQIVQEDGLAMQQNARAALDIMVREIRMAGYDPMGRNRDADPSNDFHGITCHPAELRIHTDLNGNGVVTDERESIVYLHDAATSTLRRKVDAGFRQSVADHIESVSFTCRDGLGRPATHAPDIRVVEVQITARTEHADPRYQENDGYRMLTLRSRVAPRNLR